MNRVFLIGRLVKDIEVKELSTGAKIGNFTIAVPRRYKDENGEVVVDYFRCITWKGNAESMEKFTHKGSQIAIAGTLQNRCWDDNGEKKYYTEVNVDEIKFLDSKETPKGATEVSDDDCPF